ncbi:MAG: hypothetical protein HY074_01465 [Deltaproteobacteria bacterium]|nr:hypothetical protein [Deltaproteobacteria bacterium]
MLFSRVLGIAFVAVFLGPFAYCEGAKHLYLVAKPITVQAKLGPVAKAAYYVLPGVDSAVKVGMLYASTGQPILAIGYGVFEGSKSLLQTRIFSTLDLRARAWFGRRAPLQKLKNTPGVERLMMLTAADFKYQGLVADRVEAQSLIFLESSEAIDLKQPWNEELGDLVEIADLEATRVRMTLAIDGDHDPLVWNTNLQDVFEHASMPEEVAHSWEVALAAHDTVQPLSKQHVTKAHEDLVAVKATLVFSNGTEQELGTVMQAGNLRKLLGHGLMNRIKTMWRAFWGMPDAPKNLPVSSIKCEKLLTRQ